MIEFDIGGVGVWSERFSNARELACGLESGGWPESVVLQADLIPRRERRRAPEFVRMAVEVMQQACRMAGMEPSRPAVVFASRMSDMETTDAMCRVLARSPRLVSPTKFHNSVHNAAAGYWSIATSGRMPANAISAFDTSPSIALLEAAAQLHVEGTDVLVVMQDAAPPVALQSICQPAPPFAAALLLRPPAAGPALLRCRLETSAEPADWPDLPVGTPTGLDRNTSARILPLLAAAVSPPARPLSLHFPAATRLSLRLVVQRASG